MTENDISYLIRGAIFRVNTNVGPGLLESAYEMALCHELRSEGLSVQKQIGLPFEYGGEKLDIGYRMDIVVNNKVVVEVKSVESLADVHYKQLLTYLKLSGMKLGILVNFNSTDIKSNIKRIVNNL